MVAAGLSPKTIVNYSQVVKLVVASAVNAEGNQLYPRKWNHDFIGIPLVQKEKQHRPTVTETELGEILTDVSERYRILFTLLAGTGLRIGEALGLKGSDLSPDCRTIHVQRSVWRGRSNPPRLQMQYALLTCPKNSLLFYALTSSKATSSAPRRGVRCSPATFCGYCTPRGSE